MDWISIEDRLPEDNTEVLIWHKGECQICLWETSSWFDELRVDDPKPEDVTHWMPLPDPPTIKP